ncbi:hypothetical protein M218_25365 [Burkholderia pseudomallei MSHR338]|nr:hypothetical protein M218_25365 [Burkholderia pseudomallei MSHR338]
MPIRYFGFGVIPFFLQSFSYADRARRQARFHPEYAPM